VEVGVVALRRGVRVAALGFYGRADFGFLRHRRRFSRLQYNACDDRPAMAKKSKISSDRRTEAPRRGRRAEARLPRPPRAPAGARARRAAHSRSTGRSTRHGDSPPRRWQFRGGIEEPDRKAFLFTKVTDAKGCKYDIPVVVGALAASGRFYRIGMAVRSTASTRPGPRDGEADPAANRRRRSTATKS